MTILKLQYNSQLSQMFLHFLLIILSPSMHGFRLCIKNNLLKTDNLFLQLAIRSGDYYMFDDLDDDDVTDLIPDSEAEKKEKKRFQEREQERQRRRMTVSEVCKNKEIYIYIRLF